MFQILTNTLPTTEELFRIDVQQILDAGFWWLILAIAALAFISILFIIPPLEVIIYPAFFFYIEEPHLIFGMIATAIGMELLASLMAHKVKDKWGEKVLKRFYKKEDTDKHKKKLDKWGPLGLGIFAATPLPITVALYYAVAKNFSKKDLLIPMGVGRAFKYGTAFLTIFVIGIDPSSVVQWLLNILGV